MRVLFYGTPAFAGPTLEALLRGHEVVGVVTQPDRPAGRGQRARSSTVKQLALARAVPVFQPITLREDGWTERLRALQPEVAVVVAFGQILPERVLAVPPRGSINVHASLLPRHRGAAPVAWAIIRGDTVTGVTTFLMDRGMDTGPVLLQRATPIEPEETAGELAARLAHLGAGLLLETLVGLEGLTSTAQDARRATLAPRLRKEDGQLDWTRPAPELAARIRGVNPWPGAVTQAPTGRLLIWRARPVAGTAEPGRLVPFGSALAIGTGADLIEPLEVQPENRRAMAWEAFLRGARLEPGVCFGAPIPRG